MAFGLQFLAKCNVSQQYDSTYNSTTGLTNVPCPVIWTYNAKSTGANNSSAEVLTANYFLGASSYLNVGDLIWVVSNDPSYGLIYVATNTGASITTSEVL
jgi:hypothetical protein